MAMGLKVMEISSKVWLSREAWQRAHSLFPLRDIHTLDEKPQAKRRFSNQRRQQNERRYQVCEGRGKKRGKARRQITQSGNLHQDAHKLGQIARFKDQVTVHHAGETEKYQGN